MTTPEVSANLALALNLHIQIAALEEKLEALKTLFRQEAEKELRETAGVNDLPGNSYTFNGEDGRKCIVSFPAAGLVREFNFVKGEAMRKGPDPANPRKSISVPFGIDPREETGEHFKTLFVPWFKPATAFEELTRALLKPEKRAQRLLDAFTEPPGSPRVLFKGK